MALHLFRLTGRHRIGSRKRIRELIEKGERQKTEWFDVILLRDGPGPVRAAVLTPKRLGNAVTRNRIRRRMREVFRLHLPNCKGTFDLLIFPKSKVRNGRFETIAGDFENCLKSLGLFSDSLSGF